MDAKPQGLVIGGVVGSSESGATCPTCDPATGEVLADVAAAGQVDIESAVRSAALAFNRTWRHVSANERRRMLLAIADALDAHAEDLATLESLDTGKPISEARLDVAVAVRYFDFYSGAIDHLHGSVIPVGPGADAWTVREPFGVVGHIVPWNYPLALSARSIAPALAAGNTCVLKPSPLAPLTCIRLGELVLEAGLPSGCVNVVPGDAAAGAELIKQPEIGYVSFTGSIATGRLVMAGCSERVTPLMLELGGSCPHLVMGDADLHRAAPTIAAALTHNAGQTCTAVSRLIVDERVADDLIALLVGRLGQMVLGRGIDDPDMGPMISRSHRDRVMSLVDDACGRGAQAVGGGERVIAGLGGAFLAPIVLRGVQPSMRIAQEEVFGPVLSVISVRDPDEAVAVANTSPYGLAAAVWTASDDIGHRVSQRVEAGQVFVNCYGAGVELPLPAWKQSGFGIAKGVDGLLAYTRLKVIAKTYVGPTA